MGLTDVVKRLKREFKILKGEKSRDMTYSSEKDHGNEAGAIQALETGKRRLFDVNAWSRISGPENSNFQLYDSAGNKLSVHKLIVGNYIRIDLPGPFPMMWVKVTDVKEEKEMAEFTVRPAHDPTEVKDTELEHFFEKQATSTFRVQKKGTRVLGFEIGKNEAINIEQPKSGDNSAANFILAQGGWAGFQKFQWKLLTDYLVGKE